MPFRVNVAQSAETTRMVTPGTFIGWRRAVTRPRTVVEIGLLVFAVLVAGGYGFGWRWTGFRQNDTVWDWLHLVLLPVVLMLLPLWLAERRRHRRRWYLSGVLVAAAFAIFLVGGYGFGWTWTGFAGNTLWDWLNLLLIPFAIPAALAWADSTRARQAGHPVAPDPRRGDDSRTDSYTDNYGRYGAQHTR